MVKLVHLYFFPLFIPPPPYFYLIISLLIGFLEPSWASVNMFKYILLNWSDFDLLTSISPSSTINGENISLYILPSSFLLLSQLTIIHCTILFLLEVFEREGRKDIFFLLFYIWGLNSSLSTPLYEMHWSACNSDSL